MSGDDATIIVEIPVEETRMAIDLPDNVAGLLLKTGSENYTSLMSDIAHNGANVHNLVRTGAARRFNELDPAESRAVSGVLATPIASPTTQSGTGKID